MSKKLPEGSDDPRLTRLRALATGQSADVCGALAKVWEGGQQPQRILIRRSYARLEEAVSGPVSDRKLPSRKQRPPSTRLTLPRGVALPFYLTMIFVAQCERARKQAGPPASRPLVVEEPTAAGVQAWTNLVMVPATHRVGSKTSTLVETNRVRQLEAGLRTLAADDMRLVELPHAGEARGPLRNFVPLVESGLLGQASRVPYFFPGPVTEVFSVPAAFFLNGWHSALTPSEVAMLFAVWASSPSDSASRSSVYLEGDTRIRRYGLSPDAYGTQAFLEELDVLDVTVPPGRRPDGTFVGQKKGDSPLLNSFRIIEAGFNKPAVPTVMATWKTRKSR